jgi:hypothetical protein
MNAEFIEPNRPLSEIYMKMVSAGLPERMAYDLAKDIKETFLKEADSAYICSPLAAPEQDGIRLHMKAARNYCKYAEYECGYIGVAPHAWLPELLDDNIPQEREIGITVGTYLMKKCKVVFVCGNRLTNGMKAEIILAAKLGMPVVVFNYNLYGQVIALLRSSNVKVTTDAIVRRGRCGLMAMDADIIGRSAPKTLVQY